MRTIRRFDPKFSMAGRASPALRKARKTAPPCLALLAVLMLAGEAPACPNCKEAVAGQDGDAMRLANGYSWSILLMIGMPFAILGTGTLMVARAVKSGRLPEL